MRYGLAVAALLLSGSVSAAQIPADEGIALAAACTGCHGGGGVLPPLSGLPPDELREMLIAYRSGARTGTVMNRIAKGYSRAELAALAFALGRQASHKSKPGA